MLQKLFYHAPRHVDPFAVHFVTFDAFALHGFEGAGTHVERQLGTFDAATLEGFQHRRGEVQACCRGGHAAFDLGINGLVGFQVAGFSLAVEVGWDGELSAGIEDLCPCHFGIVP